VGIGNDADRLACFDAAYAVDLTGEDGTWKLTTESSRLIDQVDVFLTTESRQLAPLDFGRPQRAQFEIRCRGNVTTALFWIGGNYMSDYGRYGQIVYRVGDQQPRTLQARVTGDSEYIGLLNGSAAIPFIKQLIGADELLIRVRPINQSDTPIELEFSLVGLDEAIAPLRESCGW
jgi:type VI secretion system protein VasI